MRFATAEALGKWARAYQVTRVAFHSDGAIAEAEFSVLPDLGNAEEPDNTPAAPSQVQKALDLLALGRRQRAADDE